MEIEFQTDIGRRRRDNQDNVGVYYNQKSIPLAIVADGMGGHQAGAAASQLAVSTLGKAWEHADLTDIQVIKDWLETEIQQVNQVVYQTGSGRPEMAGMGTTLVVAAICQKEVVIAHVGDSRAYLIDDVKAKQITEDHSLVNTLVKAGEISSEMARNHPQKNILTQSIGTPNKVKVEVASFLVVDSEKLLLCSDGLTNMLMDEELHRIVNLPLSLKARVDQLIAQANEIGGLDNITVLLIETVTSDEEDNRWSE